MLIREASRAKGWNRHLLLRAEALARSTTQQAVRGALREGKGLSRAWPGWNCSSWLSGCDLRCGEGRPPCSASSTWSSSSAGKAILFGAGRGLPTSDAFMAIQHLHVLLLKPTSERCACREDGHGVMRSLPFARTSQLGESAWKDPFPACFSSGNRQPGDLQRLDTSQRLLTAAVAMEDKQPPSSAR